MIELSILAAMAKTDPETARQRVAIVLPAWKEASELPATLDALAAAARPFARAQVAVVAGGDEATVREAHLAFDRHPSLGGAVVPQRPLGKMAALADGVEALERAGGGHWLLVLDADTWLEADALLHAVEFLRRRADLAGCGPHLLLEPSGVGAAHDLIHRAVAEDLRSVPSVSGGAVLLRGDLVWPRWREVFGPHDYPLHVDYQMCERIYHATGCGFAIAPRFEARTPRGRGWDFVRAERRHHRALFARLGLRKGARYLVGAVATSALPAVPLVIGASVRQPWLWPVAGTAAAVAWRRMARWRREHAGAATHDTRAAQVSLAQYVRDEWLFSMTTLLGVGDLLRKRSPEALFRGVRR